MEEDDQQQIEVLALRIAKEEYDLIGLQEVNQLVASPLAHVDSYFQPTTKQQAIHKDNFLFCLTERLKELGCYYYWSWTYNHIGYDIYHEGVGLLSKTPIEPTSLLISATSDPIDYHTRRALIGETVINNQRLIVVSGHFSWWQTNGKSFAYEWGTLEKALLERDDALIIMGDFNNDARKKSEGYDLVLESSLGLQDAFTLAENKHGENTVEESIDGWDKNTAKLRIDYVFTSKKFGIKKYCIVFNGENEHTISDHYGIEVAMD